MIVAAIVRENFKVDRAPNKQHFATVCSLLTYYLSSVDHIVTHEILRLKEIMWNYSEAQSNISAEYLERPLSPGGEIEDFSMYNGEEQGLPFDYLSNEDGQ